MEIKRIPVGPIGTNCYIFTDGAGHGAIVDPGAEGAKLLALAREMDITVDAILLTHGHFDHTGGAEVLHTALGCPVYLHPLDKAQLGVDIMPALKCPITEYSDGDTVQVGDIAVTVIHTPGHTPGGVCLLAEDALFAGDTLFKSSMGRTDLPCGNYETLMASLKRLGELEGNYAVLPGHEGTSDLNAERASNYYLMEAMSH